MSNSGFITRLGIIIGLIFLLIIPLWMVKELTDERAALKRQTIQEVSSKWGDVQLLAGPFLEVPDLYNSNEYVLLTPNELTVMADLSSETKQRGIYEVPLYKGDEQVQEHSVQLEIKRKPPESYARRRLHR